MDGSIHEDEMRNYGAHSEVVGRVLTVCACYFIECEIKKNQSMKATTHETHDENDFDKPEQNVN